MNQNSLDKIAFDGVDRHTKWLKISGREVVHYVSMLIAQRPFETRLEADIEEAERALNYALQKLQEAKAIYKSLPQEKES